MGWCWGAGLLMAITCVVFVVVVAWIILRLARHGGYDSMSMTSTKQTPINMVKERYAKGEITKEQFDQIKKDLG